MALVDMLHIPLELIRCHADGSGLVEHRLFTFHHRRFKERPTCMALRLPRTDFACIHLLEEFLPSRLTAEKFFKLGLEGLKEFLQSFEDWVQMRRNFFPTS